MGCVPGPAHGHVGEFSAAAVFVAVGGVHGGALGAVDGDGVPEGQPVSGRLFGGEGLETAVVHAGREGVQAGVDLEDPAPFAGDQLAVGAGGEGDDAVPGGVAAAAGGCQKWTSSASLGIPAMAQWPRRPDGPWSASMA